MDLKGYKFDDDPGIYRGDVYRKECARLLKWWDSRHVP
jgi:hypothetical protein